MVRALGSASPREHAGAGSDSGLGEEQPDLQACQSLPHHLTPVNMEHFATDNKEEAVSESVTDTLLPDFSCLAVVTRQPPRSEQSRQLKAETVSSENAQAH